MLNFIAALLISLLYCLSLSGCDSEETAQSMKPVKIQRQHKPVIKRSKLAQIKHDGVLRVLTRTNPNSYYSVAQKQAGLEYDLVTLFAKELGVKVEFYTAQTLTDVLNKIERGEFDVAAAGLAITENRMKRVRFSMPYHDINEQVIYRSGTPRPKTLQDLNVGIFEVIKDSSHVETLQTLKETAFPELTWLTNSELDSNSLIDLLDKGLIDYTVADSTQALSMQRFYPKLQIAFDIGASRQIGWALPKSTDNSLYYAVNAFFKKIKKNKTLEQLLERYYGHLGSLDYVDKCKFYQHHQTRLPLYKPYFIQAAKQYDLDWRLLAAIGYQESHWENEAVSPTGVKGIMMLTNDAALQVGISDRTDPSQSILGGALYFQQQLKKIPPRISEPDRVWFALAAYNVGFGHVQDARILTRQQKLNPDKWLDVKKALPLLTEESWFMQTKYGYARGEEPVLYVENIRNYYDLLVWLNSEKTEKKLMRFKNPQLDENLFNDLLQKIKSSWDSTKKWITEQIKYSAPSALSST